MNTSFLCAAAALAIVGAQVVTPGFAAAPCSAVSGAMVPVVVELYTSEGCDSCPPADRWLSKQINAAVTERSKDASFIALAFHVDYWDYIGWKDVFAQPAFTQRQSSLAASGGASGVYTPQIFVNGRDDRSWTSGAARLGAGSKPASVRFSMTTAWRDDASGPSIALSGKLVEPSASVRLRYAVTENGLVTVVKAGENRGVTLRHDAVVRAHGVLTVDGSGAFGVNVRLPKELRRNASQLHLIAEDSRGNALAAATLACAG